MVETTFRGPVVSAGSLMDQRVETFDGPAVTYQGDVLPDVRFGPIPKDTALPGQCRGFMSAPVVMVIDNFFQSAANTALIAASAVSTSGTPVTLNATAVGGVAAGSPSLAPGIPIVPFGQQSVTTVMGIDFGFTTGTTVANSSTVVVVDSTLLGTGLWLMVGGAGAGNRSGTFAQIQTIANATTITVAPVMPAALSNAPIGRTNLHGASLLPPGTQFGPATVTPSAVSPVLAAGFVAVWNPAELVSRAIRVNTVTTVSGTAQFLVTGYDCFGQLMTELMSAVLFTAASGGKKAFKYIQSIVPQQTQAGPFTISLQDVVGLPLRVDSWNYTETTYQGASAVNSAGFTSAFVGPANATTGDVRGTFQLSTTGPLGTSVVAAISNGTSRLTILVDLPPTSIYNATPINNGTSMFGPVQA